MAESEESDSFPAFDDPIPTLSNDSDDDAAFAAAALPGNALAGDGDDSISSDSGSLPLAVRLAKVFCLRRLLC